MSGWTAFRTVAVALSAFGLIGCTTVEASTDGGFQGVLGTVGDGHFAIDLVGATVKAVSGGRVVAETRTNAEGGWELELEPGEYTISANYTYSPQGRAICPLRSNRTVHVASGQSVELDFRVDSRPCFN